MAIEPAPATGRGPLKKAGTFYTRAITVVAVAMSAYTIIHVSGVIDLFGLYLLDIPHRFLFLAFILTLGFLMLPIKKGKKTRLPWYDVLFALIGIAGPLYNFVFWTGNAERYMFQQFYPYEIAFAVTTTAAVLEVTRRSMGWEMTAVAGVFLAHVFLGSYIPGPFHAPPVSIEQVVYMMVYLDQGIYSVALGTAATLVIMFVIFSAFLFATGAGDFMIEFAIAFVGHVRGGAAKVAVIASALMGTITGSTSGNIAAVGVFTIPMMKKSGYSPDFAAAVETVSSIGGQIMPPIMGVVAFVMAEWLGISYWSVCLAALVPAILYFLAEFIMVDAEAARLGLHGLPRSQLPSRIQAIKKGWLFFIPFSVLVFSLAVLLQSPQTAVMYGLGILIALNIARWVYRSARSGGVKLQSAAESALSLTVKGLKGGATNVLGPAIACACAGIIIGALSITQVGIPVSQAAVDLSGHNLLLMLVLTAVACYILGLGMSSLPAYIMTVLVAAPALTALGVPPLYAHLFVFWFAITGYVTPPVAVGAYVAAGIAGSSPNRTALKAMQLSICLYTLPFMFVYRPALLLRGTPIEIVVAVAGAIVGVAVLAWGVAGYFLRPTNLVQRLMLLASGVLFMTLDPIAVSVGVSLAVIVLGWQMGTIRREKAVKVPHTASEG